MNREELVRAMDRYNQAVEELKQAEHGILQAGVYAETPGMFKLISDDDFLSIHGELLVTTKDIGPYGVLVKIKKLLHGQYENTISTSYAYKRMWASWGRSPISGKIYTEYDKFFTCIKCGREEFRNNTGGLLVVADGYFTKPGIYKFTEREGNIDNIEFVTPLDFEPYLDDDTGHLCHNCREHYKTML